MDRNRIGRMCGTVPRALVALLLLSPAANAQEVNEDYIVHHLGPAAEAMQRAGVDGSGESTPTIIEIGRRWLIEPAFWVTVDEVRRLVRSAREDGIRTRQASLADPLDGYPSRRVLATFGVARVGLTCGQAQEKARTAQRLADSLSRVSQLNGAGTGLMGVISQGAARFVAPMAFATMVTGFAATWASQLASGYRNAPCLAGGQLWRFGPNLRKVSISQDPCHVPPSSRGPCGWASAGSLIGITRRRQVTGNRSCCPSRSGPWRSL